MQWYLTLLTSFYDADNPQKPIGADWVSQDILVVSRWLWLCILMRKVYWTIKIGRYKYFTGDLNYSWIFGDNRGQLWWISGIHFTW